MHLWQRAMFTRELLVHLFHMIGVNAVSYTHLAALNTLLQQPIALPQHTDLMSFTRQENDLFQSITQAQHNKADFDDSMVLNFATLTNLANQISTSNNACLLYTSVGRGEVSREAWQADIKGMLDAKFKNGYDQKVFERFIARNHYQANPPTDPDAFKKMKETLSNDCLLYTS